MGTTLSSGERIKELRILAEMSQDELGRRVGVQRAAINKYEKGTVENIPIKTIEKIAQVFDVSPAYIVGWTNQEANLSAEVKTIQGVKLFFGKESVELLESFNNLTPKGKKKVLQYLDDIYWMYKGGDVN
jgi:transcriptional regulator with XRE-family HTH domain